MIVGTIIVILGLAVLIGLNPQAQFFKGFDTRRRSDLDKIKIAFETYYSDKGCYPPASVLTHCGGADLAPYLSSIPCDPNTNTPYKVSVQPPGSSCPQQYAIYASLYSFFSRLANPIAGCPQTYAVYSESMTNVDLVAGCSGVKTCVTKYGCKSGACTVVAVDIPSPCAKYYCESDCGGVNCGQKDRRGRFINECVPI